MASPDKIEVTVALLTQYSLASDQGLSRTSAWPEPGFRAEPAFKLCVLYPKFLCPCPLG